MSTRCQIVKLDRHGNLYPVKIYKHCDGYPEGVMDILAPFAAAFAKDRGDDDEYFIAQCIRQFGIDDASRHAEEAEKVKEDPSALKYLYDPTASFTGWGCSTFWHGDIEYLYVVGSDGSVKIIRPNSIPRDWPDNKLLTGTEVSWPRQNGEDDED